MLSTGCAVAAMVASAALFMPCACQKVTAEQAILGSLAPPVACEQLSREYPELVYWPGTDAFEVEAAAFWSRTCVLEPACVFAPDTPLAIARAIPIFHQTEALFAVRGGGHMPVPEAASIDAGVLVVMTNLRTFELSPDHSVVSVGSGLLWSEVYDALDPYGLIVVGGRVGAVGVPGLILGQGISHYSGLHGWASNNVINFEIALADGSVVNANCTSHSDLFWALKGGSNNYGIVTRFDLRTYAENQVTGGTLATDASGYPAFLNALAAYFGPHGGIQDPASALVPGIFIWPGKELIAGNSIVVHQNDDNDIAPASIANFSTMSNAAINTIRPRNYSELVSTELGPYNYRTHRQSFMSTGLRASPESVFLVNETLSQFFVDAFREIDDCYVVLVFQPMPSYWFETARSLGGDPLDIDPAAGHWICLNVIIQWTDDQAYDDLIRRTSLEALRRVDAASKDADLFLEFVYLNDAFPGQENPFQYYGSQGKNWEIMKDVRRAYDPDGIFQTLMPGGWKVGL